MKRAIWIAVLAGFFLACLPASEALGAQAPAPGRFPTPAGAAGMAPVGKPGAAVLSLAMPGTGEWLNRDFAGQFPFAECIVGYICCFVQLSSTLDAAAGDRSEKIRLDFWSKPIPER